MSGGAPPVHLAAQRAYLGLAHFKEARASPHLLGSSAMVYRHLFYAFDDAPPFALRAAGMPFALPQPGADDTPTVQFASGLALAPGGDEVLISYSALDCGARLATVRLDEVLRDVGLVW